MGKIIKRGIEYSGGGGGSSESDVFVAQKDVTTFEELKTAVESNKTIMMEESYFGTTVHSYAVEAIIANFGVILTFVYNYNNQTALSVYVVDNQANEWTLTSVSLQKKLTAGNGVEIVDDTINATKWNVSKGATNIIGVEATNASKFGFEFGEDVTLTASSPMLFGEARTLQEKLVSGESLKTINNQSLLGSGNIDIQGGGGLPVEMRTMGHGDIGSNPPRGIEIAQWQADGVQMLLQRGNGEEVSSDVIEMQAEDLTHGVMYAQIPTVEYMQAQIGTHFEVGVEKWCGTYKEAGATYQVYSKIIKIDALPSTAGITNYPHGITGIKQILQVYGFTTDGFVLNAPRQTISDSISIYQVQKAGNIAIEVGKDRSNKSAYVCLIYAKNN